MSRKRYARRGFGYALNYDKEIATDEAEIAAYDRALAAGYVKPDALAASGYYYPIWRLVLENRATATAIGLTTRDLYALADYLEIEQKHVGLDHDAPEVPETGRAFLERGKAALTRCAAAWPFDDLLTLAQLKHARRTAVAARSRHRRNKLRYGVGL